MEGFGRNIGRYDYDELKAAAISPNATQDDLANLASWFDLYCSASWNGEYYDVDEYKLFPVYSEKLEFERYEIR